MGKILYVLLVVLILISPWTWRVSSYSLWGVVVAILVTFVLLKITLKYSKKAVFIFLVLMSVLAIFQHASTKVSALDLVSNDDRRLIDLRMRAYPPVYFGVLGKTIWIPAAHWLEEKPYLLIGNRFVTNVFENLDLNQYFFAGHPKERLNSIDFDKYYYLFLPLLLMGWFNLANKKGSVYWSSFFVSLFLLGVWGNQSPVGPLILYPFLSVGIVSGTKVLIAKYEAKKK